MDSQVPARIKSRRYREAMTLQKKIARELAAERVGQTLRILVDQPRIGRTEADAPDVDCRVVLDKPAAVGEFINVYVHSASEYDLCAAPLANLA
jgi:ribosomal protein S12 methylthiotransferase